MNIIEPLKHLDSLLTAPARITLAGSAVPILAGCKFRRTADIDFAFLPADVVRTTIANDEELRTVFDFNAQGIIGLLEDTEDRLVTVDLDLKYLIVERLSLMDWVVSKLASPKLTDALDVTEVTLDMLLEIERRFPFYCGVSYDRAYNDLRYLIAMLKEREDQN